MRVKFLKGWVVAGRWRRPGFVQDLPEEAARDLILRGIVEPESPPERVATPAPETAMVERDLETAMRPRGKGRKDNA